MPTPERTSLEQIVQAGQDILESAGLAGLTMQAVADRVGVRAPSLYKRVRNRDDLVRLLTEAAVLDLGGRLSAQAQAGADPRRALAGLARAIRAFAHDRPMGYRLIFTPGPESTGPDPASVARAIEPVMRLSVRLAGDEHALDAARTFTAWANGFIAMELAGAFKLGGSVDQAFEYGIARLTDALDTAEKNVGPRGL